MQYKTIHPKLIWFSLIIFLFWGALYIYVPILPVHAASLEGASLGSAGLVVSMYGLSQLVLRIPLGILSDKLQRRKIFVFLGFILSLFASLGLGFTKNVYSAAVFRGVSGASAAMWVIISVLFASYFPQKAAVKATGFVVFLAVFAQTISSFAGGAIAERFGDHFVFLCAAFLSIVGILLFIFFNSNVSESLKEEDKVDGRFVLHWSLIAISLAASIDQYITFATTYTYIPILAERLGASSTQLGWLTGTMQLSYMTTSLLVSIFVPSHYEKIAAIIGMVVLVLASFMVLASNDVIMLIISRLLHGVGHGLSYPVLMGLAMKQVRSQRHAATTMGIFQAIYAAGMFAGPAISGWISTQYDLSAVFLSSGWLGLVSLPLLFFSIESTEIRSTS